MDAEWEKQWEEHRKRIQEITKLIVDNSGGIEPESSNDLLDKLRGVVKESVGVRTEVSKLTTVMQNVLSQVDACNDMENVKIKELHDIESQKDVMAPTYNYESQFESFLGSLRQDAEDSFIVSQQADTASVDPWTKKPIERPVRSKSCAHVYDKSSILTITKTKTSFKCPYIGCKLRITVDDLEYD
uniref:E3 SUMO-protein ligase NSE2 n=1 Tax=Lygus hesperus TaxID=30085 RepID=A0A0A9XNM8_LYGHE